MRTTLKATVEKQLANCDKCRNDDVHLTSHIWYNKHPYSLKNIDGDWFVNLRELKRLPREDHVKRIRATIQNEDGKYLPTDPSVRKKRRINEDKWREQLGYNAKLI